MPTSNITIRIDTELKKQAEDLFSDLGLNMTTAIIAFTRQAVREQRIPFHISRNVPNKETLMAIDNVKNGANLSRGFTSVEELMADLDADD